MHFDKLKKCSLFLYPPWQQPKIVFIFYHLLCAQSIKNILMKRKHTSAHTLHTHTCTFIHALTHTCTHSYIHTHTHTHIHTHTHSNTRNFTQSSFLHDVPMATRSFLWTNLSSSFLLRNITHHTCNLLRQYYDRF